MALQIATERYGITFEAAYLMLSLFHIEYNFNDSQATLKVAVFASAEARQATAEPIAQLSYACNAEEIVALQQMGDTDPRQPAYRYVRQFYPDARDV